jgi:hypothetical protein
LSLSLVGYGDVVPCSFIGRTVTIFIVVCGLIYNSLMINNVSEFFHYESNETSIDEICQDSLFRKKYRIAALNFIQASVIQFCKYRAKNINVGFKSKFLFKNWKIFVLLSNFRKLRKKYKLKYQQAEEDSELLFSTYLTNFQDKLDHSIYKINDISLKFFTKSARKYYSKLDRGSIYDDFNITGKREAIQHKIILSNLEQERTDINKLTHDLGDMINKFSEREGVVNDEVSKMSQLIQTRASNMFLNVINNIKK